ncbi:MAG: hypothetical protein FWE37_01150 [Spirochaetaceae bacterium]|nr:hypothetical protein [Spirochaetaceae bacterium]
MLPFLGIIAAVLGLITIIAVIELKFEVIKGWFREKSTLMNRSDSSKVAFTLKEGIKKGKYRVVQGIFDKESNKLLDGVRYEAERLDNEIGELHSKDKIVIYE